jgi:hypothetical protein
MKWQLAILLVLSPYATVTAGQVNCEKLTLIPLALCSQSEESSWIFRPSYFSHDPATGKRVAQYAQEPTSYRREDPTYLQSGYRHNQSILRGADGSADRQHIVETWGKGELIRPYGEWLFPYRAGATPYGPWGNPQGPWTLPFDSWQNPYGLLQHWPTPYGSNGPYPPGPGGGGYPGAMSGYGSGYGAGPGPGYGPGSGHGAGPGSYGPPTPHGTGGQMDD